MDGLRAYAAIGIVLMHVLSNILVKPTRNYLTTELIPFFTDFTLLFMMVSGFSLCCGYYPRIKDGTITPNAFYKKRYMRILPFFALLCLLDFVISPSREALCEVFANMTLCFGLLPSADISVIGVGWFLGVIFLFYMLFPFFVFMLDNKRRAWISFALAILFVYVSMLHFSSPGRKCMIFCAPLFISGGLTYLYRDIIASSIKRHHAISCFMTLAATICFFAIRSFLPTGIFSYCAELALFVIWLVYAVGTSDKILNNRFVKYVSGISMEIYLAHMIIFRVIEKLHLENHIHQSDLLYIVTSLLTLCGVVCFAHVTKYYVINKLVDRRH